MKKIIGTILAVCMTVSTVSSIEASSIDYIRNQEIKNSFDIEFLLDKDNVKGDAEYGVLMGKNRIETSIEASKKTYPNGSKTAVIVNGFVYADSISAIAVASNLDAPILLTGGENIEREIEIELKRLDVKNIVLVGGSSSVSEKIYEKLEAKGYTVSRISGDNRYLTNQKVVEKIFNRKDFEKAIFVSGENFADSISAGVYAYKTKSPIILVPASIDGDNKKYLSELNIRTPILVGGTRYLSKDLDYMYANSERYAGLNRYDTSYIINTKFFSDLKNLVLTTGEDFADALSGVPYASKNEANLVLYDNNPRTYINSDKYSHITCLGGRIKSKLKTNYINKFIYSKDYIKSADMILSNKFPRNGTIENPIEFKGTYSSIKSEPRSLRRRIYGFFYLNDLVNAFEETGDRSYLEKGMDLIRLFEKEQANTSDEMMWHDETTARRLDNYLRFYSVANILINSSDKDMINRAMYNMANKMSSTNFWSGNYNHGLFQDMSVLRYANYIGNRNMYKLAVIRAAKYFNTHFDNEGVHIENSPEYHFVMLRELSDFLSYIDRNDSNYYDILKNKYEISKKYSKAIILPNGYLPVVGDTGKINPKLEDYYENITEDNSNKILRNKFKNAGYDIAKNKDTFLMLRAGYITDIHHHNDDLSFWLYKDGNIFTEAGAFGYEYSNPISQYVRTFKAHNSLVVDSDNNYPGLGKEVKILDGEHNTMLGITKRNKNVVFTRSIKYNSDITEINIGDKIQSSDNKNHKYELYLHLDPSISVSLKNNEAILKRSDIDIGKVKSTATMRLEKDIFCENYNHNIKNTSVIVLEVSGKDKFINTKIELK